MEMDASLTKSTPSNSFLFKTSFFSLHYPLPLPLSNTFLFLPSPQVCPHDVFYQVNHSQKQHFNTKQFLLVLF